MKTKNTSYTLGEMKRVKDLNFFERYDKVERDEKTVSKTAAIQTILIGMIAIGCIGTSSILRVADGGLERKIAEVQAYINDPKIVEELTAVEKKLQLHQHMTAYYEGLKIATAKLDTKIRIDESTIQELKNLLPPNTFIEEISYAEGVLYFQCRANTAKKISSYISELRNLDFVHLVTYDGATKGTDNFYYTPVELILKLEEVQP